MITFIIFQLFDIIDKGDTYALKLNKIFVDFIANLESKFGFRKNEISLDSFSVAETIKDNVSNIFSFKNLSGGFFTDMVLVPLYMFFFLICRKFFNSFIYKVFTKNTLKVTLVLNNLYYVQQNYLGLFIVMLIVGVLNAIGLLL